MCGAIDGTTVGGDVFWEKTTYPKNIEKYVGLLEMGAGMSYLVGPLYGAVFYYIGGYTWTFVSMVFLVVAVIPVFVLFKSKIETLIHENRESLLSNFGEQKLKQTSIISFYQFYLWKPLILSISFCQLII